MIRYTNNRGQSIELTSDRPFRLLDIEGAGGTEADVQTQKSPYQDGVTLLDSPLEARTLTLFVGIIERDKSSLFNSRKYISSVFNPKTAPGTLEYIVDGVVRHIDCVPEASPYFLSGNDNYTSKFQRCEITLLAPNPYWRSPELKTEPLAAYIPKFKFPFSFPVTFGERGSEAILVNDGDVPAPVEIEFNGPAVNPIITNETTGEYIRVIRELFEGDKLIINTAFGRDAKVQIIRDDGTVENGWGYIDIWESALFKLDTGENRLTYNALSGGAGAVASVSYRNMYVGV